MPVSDGWCVHYFSVPDFDAEPGDTYSSFETALAAIGDILPMVNAEEERARALQELEQRFGQAGLGEGGERHPRSDQGSRPGFTAQETKD
jgi:hypothetical protein